MPSSLFICDECRQRELAKVLQRAWIEQAHEIIFEQKGENFLIQKYYSSRLVQYSEPCHSKVYRTFSHILRECSQQKRQLTLENGSWEVSGQEDSRFLLKHKTGQIVLTFREV